MSSFDDRKNAFEKKFAHDAEMQFRAEARCCRHFGLWIAEKIGLSGDEAREYAKTVVTANIDEPGFDDVKRKVQTDLKARKVEISDHQIDSHLARFMEQAQAELIEESKKG